jgi:D-amino-acid dehydrogenase
MATAYAAARRGLSVRLVERAPSPGMGASFANGAQLSYAYTDALASPSLWRKFPRMALGLDPAFRMHWSADPGFLRWGLAFLRNTGHTRFRQNTLAVLKLALESRAAMHALLQRHRIEFDHAAAGKMHLYGDAETLAGAADIVAIKRSHGAAQEVLSPRQAIDLEPALAHAPGLAGVVYSPQEEVGDPHRFCLGLLAVLQTDYALRADFGFEVADFASSPNGVAVETRDKHRLQARHLVVCAGIEAMALSRRIGIRAPLMPMKGYSFTAPPGSHAPAISITDTSRKIVFCRLGDRMRVAGLAELGNGSIALDPARSRLLIAMARESLPDAARYDAIDSNWAGLRPMTPDSVPIIRRARPGVVLNMGHGMLGWTLAMGAGERAIRLLLEE